jgi:hypothetical protein
MVMIQFIDARTNENMIELGSRKCQVATVTWVDLLQHHGNLSLA